LKTYIIQTLVVIALATLTVITHHRGGVAFHSVGVANGTFNCAILETDKWKLVDGKQQQNNNNPPLTKNEKYAITLWTACISIGMVLHTYDISHACSSNKPSTYCSSKSYGCNNHIILSMWPFQLSTLICQGILSTYRSLSIASAADNTTAIVHFVRKSMKFVAQPVHSLRYIFRCGGKFDSAVCWWEESNSKWPPFHSI